jgi:predicted permease
MNEWLAAISPIFFLALIAVIGYAAEKSRYVPDIASGVSKLLVHITLPVMVVVSLSDQDIRAIPTVGLLRVCCVAALAIPALLAVNYFVGKLLKVPPRRRQIHAFLGAFGNVIFLGYTFISMLFGSEGLMYAIAYSVVNDVYLWSFGAYFLSRNSGESDRGWHIKYLANPNTISVLIGIAMLAAGLRFPALLHAPLERLGASTVPLSMLFIGSILAKSKLKDAVKSLSSWSACLIKLILAPLIFLLLARALGFHGAGPVMISALTLQIAMPSQSLLSALADRYHSDAAYAAQTIFLSILSSALTLPLMYLLCRAVL